MYVIYHLRDKLYVTET